MPSHQLLLKRTPLTEERLKQAIAEAAAWIRTQETQDEYGPIYYEANRPFSRCYFNKESFHTGTSGMIPYLLSVYDVLNDPNDLKQAVSIGDRLIATKDLPYTREQGAHLVGTPWSIYGGLPGEAAAAVMLYEKTGAERFRAFALSVAEEVARDARRAPAGVEWAGKGNYCIAGDSGTVLFLIYIARHLHTSQFDGLIRDAAYQMLTYGEPDGMGGTQYNAVDWERTGDPPGTYWPGIEFGTAGVAYMFAEAADHLGDKTLLDAAKQGERHLINISTEVAENASLIYMNSNHKDLFYLGHCHGIMGILKLFVKLDQMDDDPVHKVYIDRFVNGIRSTGAPQVRSRGLWNNYCYCCGTTGLLSLFLGLWAIYRQDDYLYLAEETAAVLVGGAFNEDGAGLRWYQNWDRIHPADVFTYNGYIIGNAGNTAHLAQLYLAKAGRFHAYRFVEEPFPETINA